MSFMGVSTSKKLKFEWFYHEIAWILKIFAMDFSRVF